MVCVYVFLRSRDVCVCVCGVWRVVCECVRCVCGVCVCFLAK